MEREDLINKENDKFNINENSPKLLTVVSFLRKVVNLLRYSKLLSTCLRKSY
jgi:hypothetical protein